VAEAGARLHVAIEGLQGVTRLVPVFMRGQRVAACEASASGTGGGAHSSIPLLEECLLAVPSIKVAVGMPLAAQPPAAPSPMLVAVRASPILLAASQLQLAFASAIPALNLPEAFDDGAASLAALAEVARALALGIGYEPLTLQALVARLEGREGERAEGLPVRPAAASPAGEQPPAPAASGDSEAPATATMRISVHLQGLDMRLLRGDVGYAAPAFVAAFAHALPHAAAISAAPVHMPHAALVASRLRRAQRRAKGGGGDAALLSAPALAEAAAAGTDHPSFRQLVSDSDFGDIAAASAALCAHTHAIESAAAASASSPGAPAAAAAAAVAAAAPPPHPAATGALLDDLLHLQPGAGESGAAAAAAAAAVRLAPAERPRDTPWRRAVVRLLALVSLEARAAADRALQPVPVAAVVLGDVAVGVLMCGDGAMAVHASVLGLVVDDLRPQAESGVAAGSRRLLHMQTRALAWQPAQQPQAASPGRLPGHVPAKVNGSVGAVQAPR